MSGQHLKLSEVDEPPVGKVPDYSARRALVEIALAGADEVTVFSVLTSVVVHRIMRRDTTAGQYILLGQFCDNIVRGLALEDKHR